MTLLTQEERKWFLGNVAQALVDHSNACEPPLPIEEMLNHPPEIFEDDFGVVEMYSNLWDATFARPLSERGNIFIRKDLPKETRRFALARESFSAVITSRHGRKLGLLDLFISDLVETGEQFAGVLLAPDAWIKSYRLRGGEAQGFAQEFQLPERVAEKRWTETAPE